MFGKKAESVPEKKGTSTPVETIPLEFYAGANPLVTFKNVSKEVDLTPKKSLLSASEKKHLDRELAVGFDQPLHPATLLANPRTRFIAAGMLVIMALVVSVGVVWYQLRRAKPPVAAPPLPIIEPSVALPTSTEPAVIDTVTTSSSEAAIVTTTLADIPIVFPSLLLSDSVDSDKDGLSDVEEELFHTDINIPDTDGDKFTDGHELFNLYNPAGKTPNKLSASGLVKEFNNTVFGYSVFYPLNWALGPVDTTKREVLFSTITGEYIEARVINKDPDQDFAAWFGQWAPGERYGELVPFQSVYKENGWRRQDYLVYYFPRANDVLVLTYHTTDTSILNYRSVIKMMGRSYRINGNNSDLPPRINEGGAATLEATSTAELPNSDRTTSTTAATSSLNL